MSKDEIEAILRSLPRKLRYMSDASRTIKSLSRVVVEECNGDASRLWEEETALEVREILKRIYGVGEGIARMVVLLLERVRGVQFPDSNRRLMDIKPDVHTRRVL